jgi:hypothetical protein
MELATLPSNTPRRSGGRPVRQALDGRSPWQALALTSLASLVAFGADLPRAAGQRRPETRVVPAQADAALRIEAPATLPIGASRIAVVVRLPHGPTMPLLLTVRVEGEALQVVRARFLRSDARLQPSGELRFEVPVLARAAGIALLRAELSTYRCRQSCQQVRAQGALQLQVTTSPP